MQSKEIEQLASEFEKCQRILIALGDENRLHMIPEMMKEAVQLIDGRTKSECSGNVTKENIAKIRDVGVDYVSSGALTHSAPIMDLSLKNLHAV